MYDGVFEMGTKLCNRCADCIDFQSIKFTQGMFQKPSDLFKEKC